VERQWRRRDPAFDAVLFVAERRGPVFGGVRRISHDEASFVAALSTTCSFSCFLTGLGMSVSGNAFNMTYLIRPRVNAFFNLNSH
jgi:hypothetical protein